MIKCLEIPHKVFKFSGGEIQVKLEPNKWELLDKLNIYAHVTNSDEVMELLLLTDALRRYNRSAQIGLMLPYLPYARQDRVCAPGEALALRVFTDLINSQNYAYVRVYDVHSTVSQALLNNVTNSTVSEIWVSYGSQLPLLDSVLVAPDSGSLKKVEDLSKTFSRKMPMVRADKLRDVNTGEITETVVYSKHIGKKDFFIVDDICDGGRTFIELAKVLRPLTDGKIYLYVTHGIFSKGLEVFEGLIDTIYTAYPFPNVDISNPILKVLK